MKMKKVLAIVLVVAIAAALCIAAGLIHLLITLLEKEEYLEEVKES